MAERLSGCGALQGPAWGNGHTAIRVDSAAASVGFLGSLCRLWLHAGHWRKTGTRAHALRADGRDTLLL